MANYSSATNIVWRIAAVEAQKLKHQEIEPVDLMLGLMKLVDLELQKLSDQNTAETRAALTTQVGELKCIFQESGLEPAKTRRRLRRESVHHIQNIEYKSGVIHRSTQSKDVFIRAGNLLLADEKEIKPIHLLAALLDKKESDLERLLLLINLPVSMMQDFLSKRISANSAELDYPHSPSIPNHPTGSEEMMRHCRAAIGYLELSMLSEAEAELLKIPASDRDHPMVKRLLLDIAKGY